MTKRIRILVFILALLVASVLFKIFAPDWILDRLLGRKTVEDRLAQYGPAARGRLKPLFERAGVEYPPGRVIFVGLKHERVLRVYASHNHTRMRLIHTYPIMAASGLLGPKLREGDGQVPEGVYSIESLNPNSHYHLALRISYPNNFDREMARVDGRDDLGGDIMIHGKAVSVGCLAVGDEASEDLFVLAADTGKSKIKVILAPYDFLAFAPEPELPKLPKWTPELYMSIMAEMRNLPAIK